MEKENSDGFFPEVYTPFAQIAEDRRPDDGYNVCPNFKAIVDQHKAEGWINLPEDMKAFVVCYIRDGFTIQVMLQRGCSDAEAESYLRDPLVQAAIADVSEAYAAVNAFSAIGWRAKLARALDMAMGDSPMPMWIKGAKSALMVRQVDLPSVVRLLELASKYRDMKDDPKDTVYERFAKLPWERRDG